MAFAPSAEQQAALDKLLSDQQTPGTPDYHRWLTPEQFADRFGLSPADLGTVRAWLENQGLTVESVARSRSWISFSGTAGQVETAFQTEIHRYLENGETHFANSTPPSIPGGFTAVVRSIRGLNDFRLRPFNHILRPANGGAAKPDYSTTRGSHYLAPADLATIYNFAPLYNAGIDGTGQSIVIAGQTNIQLSDVEQFRSKYGLPASDPKIILVPGSRNPGIVTGDVDEAHLDIEWSGAAAPKASIIFVYATDVFVAVQYAIDQNLAPALSTSYGACELSMTASDAASMRVSAQQANAQGITWFAASGDTGAADCAYLDDSTASVDFPGSMPEVTSVGGTEFQEGTGTYWSVTNSATFGSALSYIPETSWNDSTQDGQPSASGGGSSRFFAKPSWQTGPGVPGDNARHVPDVSLNASADHDGYIVYTQGADSIFGGTSVPAPIFAGITALVNQRLVAAGKLSAPGLGNINPTLYAMAQSTTGVFHDIVTGDNIVTVTCPPRSRSCVPGTVGYSAGPGYDLVTGWGSVDAYQLVTQWSGVSTPAPPAATALTLQPSVSLLTAADTVFLTATASSTDGSTPSGSVTFSQASNTLGTASLVGGGGVSTATLSVRGSSLAQGAGTVSATLNGSQTASITVTVGATGSGSGTPSISSALNAGSFQSGAAPGGIVSIFGSQLAQAPDVAAALPLPVVMDGVAATVSGIAAPIWYVSPGQINLQVPYEVPAGPVTLVLNNNGRTTSMTLNVTAAAPGIFTDSGGNVVPSASAARGGALVLYITGAGAVSPAIANGAAPSSAAAVSQLPVPNQATTVTIGGVSAPVSFVGVPSGVVGVVQINVQVPTTVATGQQPVVVNIGGIAGPAATVTITP
jgi:uncharacterized protein (TIGR03437 family)